MAWQHHGRGGIAHGIEQTWRTARRARETSKLDGCITTSPSPALIVTFTHIPSTNSKSTTMGCGSSKPTAAECRHLENSRLLAEKRSMTPAPTNQRIDPNRGLQTKQKSSGWGAANAAAAAAEMPWMDANADNPYAPPRQRANVPKAGLRGGASGSR